MDGKQFDGLIRRLTAQESRRGLLGGLIGSVVAIAGAGLTASEIAEAKKGGKGKGGGKRKKGKKGKGQEKVLICHKGKEIVVARPAVDAHVRNHGDTVGPCPAPNACASRDENDPCTLGNGTTGACCGGKCTPLNTRQNCRSCGDVCDRPPTPAAAWAAAMTWIAAAVRRSPRSGPGRTDRCCGQSECTGINPAGDRVCCGVTGISPCSAG